jgi:hypothetical protein
MAWTYDVNNVGGAIGGPEVFYDWKELLVLAGWSVKASGGGTGSGLYSGVGDVLTTPALMNVNLAWFVIRAPAGMTPRREFLVQRGTTNVLWRVAVSAEDGFSDPGGADEDTVFTSTDQQFLIGAATPTFETMFAAASSYKYHVAADAGDPWAFYFFCIPNGGGPARSYGIFDPLAPSSFDSLDQDPAIYTWGIEVHRLTEGQINLITGRPKGWYKKDLAGEAFVNFQGMGYSNGSIAVIPGGAGTNPYDGDHNYFPIPYARSMSVTTPGWKGFGTVLQWIGSPRTDMDTLSTSGVKDRICVGPNCVLPWPDLIPLV